MSKETSTDALKAQIWELWVRGVSVETIAKRFNLTPTRVARYIDAYLERQTRKFAKLKRPETQVEKVINQLETLEYYLFMQITQYHALWGEKIKENDIKGALEISEQLREIIDTLQSIVTRKAELMRRFGLVPSAAEKVAATVVTVNPAELIGEITPRLPTRAKLELPEVTDVQVEDVETDE